MRSVAFKALAVGLASLMLMFAWSISTVWAGPSHSVPGQPFPSGGIQFPTPFIISITGLLIDKVTDCATGPAIPPEKLTAEFVFREGAQPPFQLSQLEKIIIKAEGYQPKEITSFMTMQFQLGLFGLIFIIPLERTICLPPLTVPPPPPQPCQCTDLTIATGQPIIRKWVHSFEVMTGRGWVQYDIFLPVTYTITCQGQQPPTRCQGAINVAVNSVFTGQPLQDRLWDTQLRCQGPCPGTRTQTRYVRYSFGLVEARPNAGLPLWTELPFTADITFRLTPVNCPGQEVEIQLPRIQIQQPGQPNPNPGPGPGPLPPPFGPLPPMPKDPDPNIERDPYVAQLEDITPVGNGGLVSVRVGNNGTLSARVRLTVTLELKDGTTATGSSELVLPGNLEFSVPVFVPMAPFTQWETLARTTEVHRRGRAL